MVLSNSCKDFFRAFGSSTSGQRKTYVAAPLLNGRFQAVVQGFDTKVFSHASSKNSLSYFGHSEASIFSTSLSNTVPNAD